MLKLRGFGLGPAMEFDLDPSSGRYLRQRLKSESHRLSGSAGIGQELWLPGRGVVLCSLFADAGRAWLHIGAETWNFFEPGLRITHADGALFCRLMVVEPGGRETAFRYKRKDFFLMLIDSTYDQLDSELANLPATLPSMREHDEAELIAWLSAAGRTGGP